MAAPTIIVCGVACDSLTARLASQTKPVVDYYSKLGLYSPIDANQKSDTVKAAIAAILK
jgi:adenylate kinase family enzyme